MSAMQEFRDKLAAMLQGKGEPPIGEMATAILELDERLRRVEEQTAKTAQLMSQQELAVLLEKVR